MQNPVAGRIMSRSRSIIVKIIWSILSAMLIVILILSESASGHNSQEKYSYVTIGEERINVFTHGDDDYVFLPSYADEDMMKRSPAAKKLDITVMHSANLPTIFIDTESGSIDEILADKNYSETAKIRIYDKEGVLEKSVGLKSFKGRGNYSWNNWEKKPFALSLKKEDSLLGLGSGTKYALIANASDATLMRNDIAFRIEEKLGIKYAHTGRHVDLYVNGDYMGNYYLMDAIDAGVERIDIRNLASEMDRIYDGIDCTSFPVYETPEMKGWNLDAEPEDITGGYIVEREFGDRYMTEYGDNPSCFITAADEHFVVSSPKYCSKAQINYIKNLFDETEKAILSSDGINPDTGKSVEEYIDIESFTVKILAAEVTLNYDAGVSSEYFYKDSDRTDSRLYAGPGWDYDMSMGNYLDWMEFEGYGPGRSIIVSNETDSSKWYAKLYHRDDVNRIGRSKYIELCPYIDELTDKTIPSYKSILAASAKMDGIRWQSMYDENGYTTGDDEEYIELQEFIRDRKVYLCERWNIE